MIFKWFNTFRVRTGLGRQPSQEFKAQWTKDYQLVPWGNEALFSEYLEMGKIVFENFNPAIQIYTDNAPM